MKAIEVDQGRALELVLQNGTAIGRLELTAEGQKQIDRLKEVLTDIENVSLGELRRCVSPVFREMARQDLKSVTIIRGPGNSCRVRVRVDEIAKGS